MRLTLSLALGFLGACSHTLESDIAGTRAEIVELQKNIPPEAPLWIFEGPDRFDQVVTDGDPGIPDYLYHHLLKKLDGFSDEEIDGQSKGDFNFDEAAKDPGLFRGKIWRVHGIIGELHTERIDNPKIAVSMAHAGVFFIGSLKPVLFHVTRKPEILTLREDAVETRAVFVKWIDYKSKSGRTITAPFFVGKTLRRYV